MSILQVKMLQADTLDELERRFNAWVMSQTIDIEFVSIFNQMQKPGMAVFYLKRG